MTHRNIWLVGGALLASVAAWTLVPVDAQSSKGDLSAHLAAWDTHRQLAAASPYKSASWSYLGPTNISGRMTDVAVADHGTSRRLYAGSCCGGVWKSDDLGETWQVVFDQAATTSTGALAVAHAAALIARGAADVVVCGGADSMINPLGIGGMSRIGAPSPRAERDACRP